MRFARFVPTAVPTPRKLDPAPALAQASPRADRFVRAPLPPRDRPPALAAMCSDCAPRAPSLLERASGAVQSALAATRSFFARWF